MTSLQAATTFTKKKRRRIWSLFCHKTVANGV